MRRLLSVALLALLLGVPNASAAISVVQTTSCSGNDATCTFSAAPSASNLVIVMSTMASTTNTLSITDWTHAEVTWQGPIDATGVRGYSFCTVGDGADTTMILTTSVNAAARTMAVEISGAGNDCTEATASDDNETGTTDPGATSHALTSATLTATVTGDFMACFVGASNSANFTTTWSPTATVQASDLEIGSEALGSYKIQSGTGSFDCTHSSAASEVAVTLGVLVKESGGGGGGSSTAKFRILMGVG